MAFPTSAYVYEFLFRGQPLGSTTPAAWHVVVAIPGSDAFGNPSLALSAPLTPDQAVAQGLGLPALLSTINTAATAQVTALQAEITALQAQIAAAPTPEPTPSSPSVTRLQAMLALNAAGLLTQVEAAVATAGAPTTIWFANAATWDRNDPVLTSIAASLNLSGQQIDALFQQAAAF